MMEGKEGDVLVVNAFQLMPPRWAKRKARRGPQSRVFLVQAPLFGAPT